MEWNWMKHRLSFLSQCSSKETGLSGIVCFIICKLLFSCQKSVDVWWQWSRCVMCVQVSRCQMQSLWDSPECTRLMLPTKQKICMVILKHFIKPWEQQHKPALLRVMVNPRQSQVPNPHKQQDCCSQLAFTTMNGRMDYLELIPQTWTLCIQ
jgi:hypothetical protein